MTPPVRSADRTLAIFEAFEAAGSQLQLNDIAEACEMPLSSCHALVQTLIKRGYVYSMGRRKELYPTVKLLRLAQNIAARDPVVSRIAGTLNELSRESGETVTLGKRQGDSVLYIHAIDGTHSIRYAATTGELRPLHSTSVGKALLSERPDAELTAWLETQSLARITPQTITSRSKLMNEIRRGRELGYFVSSGEQSADLTSVSVPIRDIEPLAISLTGPTQRVLPQVEQYGRRLLQAKQAIEHMRGV